MWRSEFKVQDADTIEYRRRKLFIAFVDYEIQSSVIEKQMPSSHVTLPMSLHGFTRAYLFFDSKIARSSLWSNFNDAYRLQHRSELVNCEVA